MWWKPQKTYGQLVHDWASRREGSERPESLETLIKVVYWHQKVESTSDIPSDRTLAQRQSGTIKQRDTVFIRPSQKKQMLSKELSANLQAKQATYLNKMSEYCHVHKLRPLDTRNLFSLQVKRKITNV